VTDDHATDRRNTGRDFAEHYRLLLQDLTEELDLHAGLTDALQHFRYASLTGQVADMLDLEAGLSAIVPAGPSTTTGKERPLPQSDSDEFERDERTAHPPVGEAAAGTAPPTALPPAPPRPATAGGGREDYYDDWDDQR
jgi:hypothetical protein